MKKFIEKYKNQGLLQIIAIILLALLVGLIFDKLLMDQHVQEQRIQATDNLSDIKSEIEQVVSLNLNLIEGLTAYIATNPNITQKEFSRLGEEILRKNPALRNIAAAPDLIIKLMHPVEGNEAAIGLDYNKNDKQRAAALLVVESKSTVIAGPLTLLQGGEAFISRTPVFIKTESNDTDNLWGVISSVLDKDKFYELAGLKKPGINLSIGIRGKDASGKNGEIFYGDPALFEMDVIATNINLPYGSWYMVGIPKNGWKSSYPYRNILSIGYLITVLVISYLLFLNKINTNRRINAEIKANQANIQKELAEESSELKSRFLANMSHELRTPMHAILSFTQLAKKRVNDEKVMRYLDNIETSSKRLTGLLNAILDLSKIETGNMDISFRQENLYEITEQCIAQVNSLAVEKNISVNIEGKTSNEVSLDESLISRVIINLISNAIKYSPENEVIDIKIIEVDATPDNSFKGIVEFIITDRGVGIPVDELESVFEKFVQSSKTDTKAGGTGLGLPICREIILMHNGVIWAESPIQGINHGTAFHFILPKGQ